MIKYFSVLSLAPIIEKFPESVSVVEGKEVVFEVQVSGTPKPDITWTLNQEPISSDFSRNIEDSGKGIN